MTRKDHNLTFGPLRALALALLATAAASCSSGSGTATESPIDVEVTFENTLPGTYWMEVGPSASAPPVKRFFLYPNATHTITLTALRSGENVFTELSLPGNALGAPRQTWNATCELGSTGYRARETTVRVDVAQNLPSLTCVGW
jgi:hypothetical protein